MEEGILETKLYESERGGSEGRKGRKRERERERRNNLTTYNYGTCMSTNLTHQSEYLCS